MNRDDVIRMAREAGLNSLSLIDTGYLEHFAALVAAAEREAAYKRRGVLMFNPYIGTPRHPSDIASDPHGILLLDPRSGQRARGQA